MNSIPSPGFRREPHRRSCLSPCARLSRVNRPTLPAPYGGGGRRPRSGREVGVVYEHRSTAETGRQGGESSTPLPVSPSPTGRFPHRYGATESIPSPGFSSGENLPANSTPLPLWHGYPGSIAMHCPPPLEGAGGGRGAAGRWGWSMNTVQRLRREDRGGNLPPPSPSAPPPRGDSPIDTVQRRASPHPVSVQVRTFLLIPLHSPVHGYRANRHALPASSRRGGGL